MCCLRHSSQSVVGPLCPPYFTKQALAPSKSARRVWCKRARRVFVNLEGTERIYTKGAGPMCPRDGYVLFRNSELLCGRLGKQTLGGGNKASLFQARAQGVVQRSQ